MMSIDDFRKAARISLIASIIMSVIFLCAGLLALTNIIEFMCGSTKIISVNRSGVAVLVGCVGVCAAVIVPLHVMANGRNDAIDRLFDPFRDNADPYRGALVAYSTLAMFVFMLLAIVPYALSFLYHPIIRHCWALWQ